MKKFPALCTVLLILAIPLVAQNYKMYQFPDGNSGAAINSSGEVAGDAGNGLGFVWTRAGGFQYLGTLGGTATIVSSLNASGYVAGTSALPNGTGHAYLWTPNGGMVDLGSPLGGGSYALFVNDAGQVAGMTQAVDSFTQHVFFWSQATGSFDIGILGDNSSIVANGFNNHGEIVGSDGSVAYRWTQSTGIQQLSSFGGSQGDARAINGTGQIVGWSTYSDGTAHAAVWAPDGSLQDIGTLPGDTSSAAAFINSAGHVVGTSTHQVRKTTITRIFFWTPEAGMIEINSTKGAIVTGFNTRDQVLFFNTLASQGAYMWSPKISLQKVASTFAVLLNDPGQFLSFSGLETPVMHVSPSSSQNPSHAGQNVTFTANVSAIVGFPPDGEQVSFLDGGKIIGTGTLSNGVASFTTSTLKAGSHNIFAEYPGDNIYYLKKSAKLQQVVN